MSYECPKNIIGLYCDYSFEELKKEVNEGFDFYEDDYRNMK